MTESQKLLADFAKTGSESAFRGLLNRYLDLVYSSAVRLVEGDIHMAQDVTQTVFVDFARKARSLPDDVMLGGWLHHHTIFVASNIMRGNRRREARERQAVEMNKQQDHTQTNLAQLAPVLDEAIDKLEVEDRTAIWLRFFEEQDFRTLGEMLNTSEEAARKRVARALEKLHSFLRHHGVSLSVAALGAALASNATVAAPVDLEAIIVGKALAKSAHRAASGQALSRLITKVKLCVAGASAVIIAGVVFTAKEQENRRRLQDENSSLRQQIGELTGAIQQSSNQLAGAGGALDGTNEQVRELLRLRGQVAVLNRQLSSKNTRVAAIVNGKPILESQVRESMANPAPLLQRMYSNQPAMLRKKLEELWTNNVETFINGELVVEDFDRRGLKVSEQELSAVMAQDNAGLNDRERYRGRLILAKMRKENLGEISEPTQEEVEQYYNENQKEFWQKDRANLFLASFRKDHETDLAVLRTEAESLRQQIMAEGVSRLKVRDKNQAKFTVRQDWYELWALRPELAKAAASLSPSGVSDIIETSDQFFILRLFEKRAAHQLALDEVTNHITKTLLSKRREAVEQSWFNRLQSQAAIERFPVPQDL